MGPMLFRFAAEVPLRWVDVDSAGVVNNAVYLSLMEQARHPSNAADSAPAGPAITSARALRRSHVATPLPA